MASVHRYPKRNSWRISYYLRLRDRLVKKAKYSKLRPDANLLKRQLEKLEHATRTGLASETEINEWVERGWLKEEEAKIAFTGYTETVERNRNRTLLPTDLQRILDGYEEYALNTATGGPERKSHRNHMSQAKQVAKWLREECADIASLTPEAISQHLVGLRGKYSEWTVCHYLTKLRLLLDQAISLGMLSENPARKVRLRVPKKSKERRILTEDEARRLLEISLMYRGRISGSLPTVVRLGLYAGLRDEEMCWLRWDAIHWEDRIIGIQESACEETAAIWIPKDSESRRLDVKKDCIQYLQRERERQENEGILGPFVMPGGDNKKRGYRRRPLSQDAPQKAFSKMIGEEKIDREITVYSLRHTYATMALRNGVDLRTLQKRMGHSSLNTTMQYLHYIEPEQHPMDSLPY